MTGIKELTDYPVSAGSLRMSPRRADLVPSVGADVLFDVTVVDSHGVLAEGVPVSFLLQHVPEGLRLSEIQVLKGRLQGPSTPTAATVVTNELGCILLGLSVQSISPETYVPDAFTLYASARVPDPQYPGREVTLSAESMICGGKLPLQRVNRG